MKIYDIPLFRIAHTRKNGEKISVKLAIKKR